MLKKINCGKKIKLVNGQKQRLMKPVSSGKMAIR